MVCGHLAIIASTALHTRACPNSHHAGDAQLVWYAGQTACQPASHYDRPQQAACGGDGRPAQAGHRQACGTAKWAACNGLVVGVVHARDLRLSCACQAASCHAMPRHATFVQPQPVPHRAALRGRGCRSGRTAGPCSRSSLQQGRAMEGSGTRWDGTVSRCAHARAAPRCSQASWGGCMEGAWLWFAHNAAPAMKN